VAAATVSDEADIRTLDAALFGARRDRMWDRLFAECAGRVLITRGRAELDGYLCPLPEALGPWGARDRESAAVLLGAAAGVGAPPRVLVPGENTDALALLAHAGFTIRRTFRHMRRGTPPRPIDWRALYGKASYCLG
jgi:Acetyltransferase (GNAT) domain